MIEKVARAIFAATGPEGCKATHGNFDILMPEIQDDIRNWARAAIAAMREPSEGMIDAAEAARRANTDVYMDGSEVANTGVVHAVFTAAIDAALSHDEVKG